MNQYVVGHGLQIDSFVNLMKFLFNWARHKRFNFRANLENIKRELEEAQYGGDLDREGSLTEEYIRLVNEQEIYWQQRY